MNCMFSSNYSPFISQKFFFSPSKHFLSFIFHCLSFSLLLFYIRLISQSIRQFFLIPFYQFSLQSPISVFYKLSRPFTCSLSIPNHHHCWNISRAVQSLGYILTHRRTEHLLSDSIPLSLTQYLNRLSFLFPPLALCLPKYAFCAEFDEGRFVFRCIHFLSSTNVILPEYYFMSNADDSKRPTTKWDTLNISYGTLAGYCACHSQWMIKDQLMFSFFEDRNL